jgi:hypothetical protein
MVVIATLSAGCSAPPPPPRAVCTDCVVVGDAGTAQQGNCRGADGVLEPAGTVCRAASGPCDLDETCSGLEASCPADTFRASGSLCRQEAGACDVAESCTGNAAACPVDRFGLSGLVCRAASGACDLAEICPGTAADCPEDHFLGSNSVCRQAAGRCDAEESCTGATAECPADRLLSTNEVCREAAGGCDVAETCSGSTIDCPADAVLSPDAVCRNAAGACDVAESCTGTSASCPPDSLQPPGVECRASAGACDAKELCPGNAAECPADQFFAAGASCRAIAGPCDAEEMCTGQSPACPADELSSAATVCRPAAGACDVGEACSGSSVTCPPDQFLSSTMVCRSGAGTCDPAEKCTGSAPACPANGFVPAGATCTEQGGNACDGSGACVVCANLCQQQTACSAGATTSISGTVFMPNGVDPLPNTLVYVPNAPLQPLTAGFQTCEPCGLSVSGSPLVSAVTDFAGRFTITNMPTGADIPLVIQNGKWRREFVIPAVPACIATSLPSTGPRQLRMPRRQSEGNLPRIAIVTGGFAALECVLLKIGVDPQEFGNGSTNNPARLHFYLSDGNPGAHYDNATPIETSLWGSQQTLNQYDLVFLGCQGSRFRRTTTAQQKLINYVNVGGRVIANHHAMEWLYNVAPFSGTARWNVDQPVTFTSDPQAAFIDPSYPPAQVLAQWLQYTAPSGVAGQVSVSHLYADFDGAVAPSRVWMSLRDPLHPNPVPMQYSFETPVGAPPAEQCGRVLFTEYHTMESLPDGTLFPIACNAQPIRPDERLTAFMVFDQGTCR